MSYGMRNGTFTGVNLSRYFNRTRCDYEQARKIINGLDKYVPIARAAERLELLLRAGCTSSFSSCF